MYIYRLPLVGHNTMPRFQEIKKTRISRDILIGNLAGEPTADPVDIAMWV